MQCTPKSPQLPCSVLLKQQHEVLPGSHEWNANTQAPEVVVYRPELVASEVCHHRKLIEGIAAAWEHTCCQLIVVSSTVPVGSASVAGAGCAAASRGHLWYGLRLVASNVAQVYQAAVHTRTDIPGCRSLHNDSTGWICWCCTPI